MYAAILISYHIAVFVFTSREMKNLLPGEDAFKVKGRPEQMVAPAYQVR
jgi:hypothetical protein